MRRLHSLLQLHLDHNLASSVATEAEQRGERPMLGRLSIVPPKQHLRHLLYQEVIQVIHHNDRCKSSHHQQMMVAGRRQVITVERPAGESFAGLNMDGSPPSEDNQNETLACEPPACLTDCNIEDDHCEHCQRCFELCKEHSGCRCEPKPGEAPWDCVICKGPEYASNAVATIHK